jgi:CDGSH-type Zn-finger protein
MSELPVIGGRAPIPVDVEAGKDYFWCACGLSAKQPFCDGSHKTTTFKPTKYTAAETKKTYFCTCKRSSKAPLCDGTHKTLAAEA